MLTAIVFIKLSAQLHQEDFTVEVDKPTSLRAVDPDESPCRNISSASENLSDKLKEQKDERVQDRPEPPTKEGPAQVPKVGPRFAHRTRFDILSDVLETVGLDETEVGSVDHDSEVMQKIDKGELIPPFQSAFWNVYGNKLRVFGTEERVCLLGHTAESEKSKTAGLQSG